MKCDLKYYHSWAGLSVPTQQLVPPHPPGHMITARLGASVIGFTLLLSVSEFLFFLSHLLLNIIKLIIF